MSFSILLRWSSGFLPLIYCPSQGPNNKDRPQTAMACVLFVYVVPPMCLQIKFMIKINLVQNMTFTNLVWFFCDSDINLMGFISSCAIMKRWKSSVKADAAFVLRICCSRMEHSRNNQMEECTKSLTNKACQLNVKHIKLAIIQRLELMPFPSQCVFLSLSLCQSATIFNGIYVQFFQQKMSNFAIWIST